MSDYRVARSFRLGKLAELPERATPSRSPQHRALWPKSPSAHPVHLLFQPNGAHSQEWGLVSLANRLGGRVRMREGIHASMGAPSCFEQISSTRPGTGCAGAAVMNIILRCNFTRYREYGP